MIISLIFLAYFTGGSADHGERKGVAVVNLEPDYCAYVLDKCPGIGQELKDALRLRVRLKTEESNGAKR